MPPFLSEPSLLLPGVLFTVSVVLITQGIVLVRQIRSVYTQRERVQREYAQLAEDGHPSPQQIQAFEVLTTLHRDRLKYLAQSRIGRLIMGRRVPPGDYET